MAAPSIMCVKQVAESANLSSVPSNYVYHSDPTEISTAEFEASIPTIDLSLLASGNPKAIYELDQACQEWGFFIVTNS